VFALELLWLFSCPNECHRFPSFGHRYYPPPAPGVSKGYLVCIYHSSPLFLNLSMCSSTVHLADTRPQSTTHAIYGEADHAPTCMYRFFRFPFVHLTHITLLFLIAFRFVPCSNPSCIITSATHSRGHAFVAGVTVSTSCHHFSSLSKHHPLFTIHCPRQTTGPSKSPSSSCTCTAPALQQLSV